MVLNILKVNYQSILNLLTVLNQTLLAMPQERLLVIREKAPLSHAMFLVIVNRIQSVKGSHWPSETITQLVMYMCKYRIRERILKFI